MLASEIVRAMLDYNYTCHRRVWDSIATLSEAQFLAEILYSHGSIRNHMVHLASTDRVWLRRLQDVPDARAFKYHADDYPTRESARAICEAAAVEVTAYAASLDEAALRRQPEGLPFTIWQVLLHLVNHGTDHRAQMLRGLHDAGAPTFDQDLVFFLSQ